MTLFAGLLLLAHPAHAVDNAKLKAALRDPAGWIEVGERDNDQVGAVRVRHKVVDEVNCLEGIAKTTVPTDILLAAAADIWHNDDWSTQTLLLSDELMRDGDTIEYVQLMKSPPFVADRYWILRATVERGPTQTTFDWEPLPDDAWPAAAQKVRELSKSAVTPDVNVGSWVFSPLGGETEVRYRLCTDAGGSLPDAIGGAAAKMALPDNIGDLVREGKRRVAAQP